VGRGVQPVFLKVRNGMRFLVWAFTEGRLFTLKSIGTFDLHISETARPRKLKFCTQIAMAYGYQRAKLGAALWWAIGAIKPPSPHWNEWGAAKWLIGSHRGQKVKFVLLGKKSIGPIFWHQVQLTCDFWIPQNPSSPLNCGKPEVVLGKILVGTGRPSGGLPSLKMWKGSDKN